MAPLFWNISRKNKRFVITVRPGSHPKNYSIPTAVLLRDVLIRSTNVVITNLNLDDHWRKTKLEGKKPKTTPKEAKPESPKEDKPKKEVKKDKPKETPKEETKKISKKSEKPKTKSETKPKTKPKSAKKKKEVDD